MDDKAWWPYQLLEYETCRELEEAEFYTLGKLRDTSLLRGISWLTSVWAECRGEHGAPPTHKVGGKKSLLGGALAAEGYDSLRASLDILISFGQKRNILILVSIIICITISSSLSSHKHHHHHYSSSSSSSYFSYYHHHHHLITLLIMIIIAISSPQWSYIQTTTIMRRKSICHCN